MKTSSFDIQPAIGNKPASTTPSAVGDSPVIGQGLEQSISSKIVPPNMKPSAFDFQTAFGNKPAFTTSVFSDSPVIGQGTTSSTTKTPVASPFGQIVPPNMKLSSHDIQPAFGNKPTSTTPSAMTSQVIEKGLQQGTSSSTTEKPVVSPFGKIVPPNMKSSLFDLQPAFGKKPAFTTPVVSESPVIGQGLGQGTSSTTKTSVVSPFGQIGLPNMKPSLFDLQPAFGQKPDASTSAVSKSPIIGQADIGQGTAPTTTTPVVSPFGQVALPQPLQPQSPSTPSISTPPVPRFKFSFATGTAIAMYQATSGTDTMLEKGQLKEVYTKQHCITAMQEYNDKSFEELRMEDYKARNIATNKEQITDIFGASAAGNSSTMFRDTSANFFGQPRAGFGSPAAINNVFGSSVFSGGATNTGGGSPFGSSGPFGLQATTPTNGGGFFSQQTGGGSPFGQTSAGVTGAFGSPSPTTFTATGFGFFGQQQQPPAAPPSVFGSHRSPTPFGGFGTTVPFSENRSPGTATGMMSMFGSTAVMPDGIFGSPTMAGAQPYNIIIGSYNHIVYNFNSSF